MPLFSFHKDGKRILRPNGMYFPCNYIKSTDFLPNHWRNSETEWIFGTPQGRKQFLEQHLPFSRVTYIMMSREYEYTTWTAISGELNEALGRFAPGNATTTKVRIFCFVSSVLRGASYNFQPTLIENYLFFFFVFIFSFHF